MVAPKWLFSEKCRSLLHLDLSFCTFVTGDFLYRLQEAKHTRTSILKRLQSLSLTDCNLTVSSLKVIKYFENISYLNVGNEVSKNLTNSTGPWRKNTIWDLPLTIFSNPQKIKELHIYNVGLPTLPIDLCLLKNLKVLNVSNNCLNWLPESITRLECLEVIDVSSNKLEHLPARLNQMVSIKELHLSDNKLSDVEKDVGSLINLQVLDLYNNCLESMPVSSIQLKTLNKFDMSMNYVSVEQCLNQDSEDGVNLLELYRKLEENLRSSLKNPASRVNRSRTPPVEVYSDYSDYSERSSYYSERSLSPYEGDCDDNEDCEKDGCTNEGAFAGYGATNEKEEENWDNDSEDDRFSPKTYVREKGSNHGLHITALQLKPEQRYFEYAEELAEGKEHYYVPSHHHSRFIPKRKVIFNNLNADQFSDAPSS